MEYAKGGVNLDRLLEILEEIQPDVDYEICQDLIDGHHLDYLMILSLIAEIEDEFDVEIPTVEIVPSNLNSIKSIYALIERLQEEE